MGWVLVQTDRSQLIIPARGDPAKGNQRIPRAHLAASACGIGHLVASLILGHPFKAKGPLPPKEANA